MINDLTKDINKDTSVVDLSMRESLVELEKAYQVLQESRFNCSTNQDKLKIVNAFDCCYELVLKILKKELVNYGVHVYSQVEIFKEAIDNNLIINSGRWFSYMEKRDLINNSYDSNVVDEIIKIVPMFEYDLCVLVEFLKVKFK